MVRELAALVNGDPVLRMDFTRAIDEALAAGNELGYSSIDELMVLLDYLMTYAPQFSENAYSSSDKPHMELQVKDGKENPENLTGRAFTG